MTFIFILFIFLVAMFIVYFDYILSIVSLSLYLCISSYNVHPNKVPWVGGRDYVSVVLICYLSANKSFVVHSPNKAIEVGSGYEGREKILYSNFPK
jgi:hypothetical protein